MKKIDFQISKLAKKNSKPSLGHDFIFSLEVDGIRLFIRRGRKICTDCKHIANWIFWFFDPFLCSTFHTTEKIFDVIFEELIISVFFCDMRDPALIELPVFFLKMKISKIWPFRPRRKKAPALENGPGTSGDPKNLWAESFSRYFLAKYMHRPKKYFYTP